MKDKSQYMHGSGSIDTLCSPTHHVTAALAECLHELHHILASEAHCRRGDDDVQGRCSALKLVDLVKLRILRPRRVVEQLVELGKRRSLGWVICPAAPDDTSEEGVAIGSDRRPLLLEYYGDVDLFKRLPGQAFARVIVSYIVIAKE